MLLSNIKATKSACAATRQVFDRVGDKWSLLVVVMLRDGPVRFNELKRHIEGISQRMLTLTLRGLECDGLVSRTIYPTTPPRVEYELTTLGLSLIRPVAALAEWAQIHFREIEKARQRFEKKSSTAGLVQSLLDRAQR